MRARSRRRRASGRPLIFAGTSNIELAEQIAHRLRTSLGSLEHETFANGEKYCRYSDSIRGEDVFLVQSCSPPVNDHLVELLLMIQAARLASARRITAVMPWFPYSRQDKKSAAREPISARLVADLLEASGVDRVLTMDLHAGQIQGFFGIPVDHMTALPLFAAHFRRLAEDGASLAAVAPDLGRVKLARRLSRALGGELAVVTKTRPRHDSSATAEVVGAVEGKVVVMGDDMIVTGGTLIGATEALLAAGALEVHAFATHALFAEDALERLQASDLAEIAVTDSVRLASPTPSKLTVLSVADVLAQTIESVFAEGSVSALFAGQELF
jgi:ribose-phosphate pyrophosphokinase